MYITLATHNDSTQYWLSKVCHSYTVIARDNSEKKTTGGSPISQLSDDAGTDATESTDAGPARELTPVRFTDLIDLYTRPRQFFSGHLNIGATKILLPVIWVLGISAQLDRVDTEIMRHEMDQTRASWTIIEPLITESWIAFWAFCLLVGIFSGALVYWIGGWWYRMRLYWSGANRDIDKQLPRYVYCWSSLILALPYVLLTIGFTFAFPNYLAAYNSDEMFSLVLIIMMFWSVGVSFVGATENFSLTKWKARLWFLILPTVFYLFALGLVMFLMAFLS